MDGTGSEPAADAANGGVGAASAPTSEPAGGQTVSEPEQLLCPITHIMYRDPVFVPESGNSYERAALEQYWHSSSQRRDPLTNVPLSGDAVHPNWGIRREVQRFLDAHPGYVPEGWTERSVPSPAGTSRGTQVRAFLLRPRLLAAAVAVAVAVAVVAVATAMAAGRAHEGPPAGAERLRPPKGSHLEAALQDGRLWARLPPRGLDAELVGQLGFAVFWLSFTGVWTTGALRTGAPVAFALFSLPFWCVGVVMFTSVVKAPLVSQTLEVGADAYTVSQVNVLFSQAALRWTLSREDGLVADLAGLPVRSCHEGGEACQLLFEDGVEEHAFGGWLKSVEATWLQREVQKVLLGSTGDRQRFGGALPERTVASHGGQAHQHHRQSRPSFGVGVGPGFGVVMR